MKKLFSLALIAALAFVAGCEKSNEDKMKDTANDAGKAVSDGAKKAGDAAKDAGDAAKDALKK